MYSAYSLKYLKNLRLLKLWLQTSIIQGQSTKNIDKCLQNLPVSPPFTCCDGTRGEWSETKNTVKRKNGGWRTCQIYCISIHTERLGFLRLHRVAIHDKEKSRTQPELSTKYCKDKERNWGKGEVWERERKNLLSESWSNYQVV